VPASPLSVAFLGALNPAARPAFEGDAELADRLV